MSPPRFVHIKYGTNECAADEHDWTQPIVLHHEVIRVCKRCERVDGYPVRPKHPEHPSPHRVFKPENMRPTDVIREIRCPRCGVVTITIRRGLSFSMPDPTCMKCRQLRDKARTPSPTP
jgi:hypothetical protein